MRLILTAFLAAASLPAIAVAAPAPVVRTVGTATLYDVPAIPQSVADAVQRYQNSRAALFEDWLPDGSMLIATRFGETQQLHHVRAPGAARTQMTFAAEPVAGAQAIPGRNAWVFGRDTGGDEWFQIYAAGPTGQPVRMTEPGTRNQSATFSKDGRIMAWSRATKGSGDYTIMIANPGDPKSARVLLKGTGAIGPADISADGRTILLTRGISNRETTLSLLDIASGRVTPVATGPAARYEDPRFTADGRGIIAISDRESDVRRLIELPVAGGAIRVLTPASKWDVEEYDLSDDGQTLAYAVNEDGFSRVVVTPVRTRQMLPQPTLPRGVLTGLRFTPDGRRLAIGLSTATSAGDVWAWDVTAGQLVRWTESELGGLDPAALAEPTLVRFKSFDGLSVPAFVYRPKGIAAGVRTPVIIDIHGGPEAQTRPNWNYGAQYFADVLGATVILPNVRGSDGYGTKYLNLDNGPKREDSVKDIGALLDWIGTQPGLDAKRVAVYGQSYGGYMSLAVSEHYADRLVGSVERYGISDFNSFMANTEAYRRDNRRAEYGDERDPTMKAVFDRISPLRNVAKIRKPMLVMQGANDPRVPQSESEQVVAGIRANGVSVSYVLFADEGHGFLKKGNNDLRRAVETVFLGKLFGVGVE
ncbi:S9 family peptidase [Sphingomonas prati]|uniref:Dipeptidyl aminopeptidase/acylaminoacyl peptidase n=1 Tax=Sphingomonas prati TaxID=1843237 RepID=A0A7W9BT68_9SPHN|nr:alpha/beta fold hydrolase [Sphingomonas prati]MBB5729489.1 dipeptidyl aminopeptidase/acylaminoacyl peptidase [Sphingomonas prati]GGE77019.1 peptidase S9 family protein [Sphingomonas prati]